MIDISVKRQESTSSILLPTEEDLRLLSFKCSYGKSLNKLTVTEDIVKCVLSDVIAYDAAVRDCALSNCLEYRIKTPESILRKIKRHPDSRFQSVFNDILGFRINVNEYPEEVPKYYRMVDLRNGKSEDDGYRAIHLYYKLDNYHYPIEVQLWSKQDYEFNLWMHSYGYKQLSSDILLHLKSMYLSGDISNFDEYMREVKSYV